MLVSAKMERAIRDRAAETGLITVRRVMPRTVMVRVLEQAEQLSPEDADPLNLFYRVRNQIVHGGEAGDEEIARAIDSGTRLLGLLLSRPRPPRETVKRDDSG